jgi:hypothetical protein
MSASFVVMEMRNLKYVLPAYRSTRDFGVCRLSASRVALMVIKHGPLVKLGNVSEPEPFVDPFVKAQRMLARTGMQ